MHVNSMMQSQCITISKAGVDDIATNIYKSHYSNAKCTTIRCSQSQAYIYIGYIGYGCRYWEEVYGTKVVVPCSYVQAS